MGDTNELDLHNGLIDTNKFVINNHKNGLIVTNVNGLPGPKPFGSGLDNKSLNSYVLLSN